MSKEYEVYLVMETDIDRITEEHIITFKAETDKEAEERFEKIKIKA